MKIEVTGSGLGLMRCFQTLQVSKLRAGQGPPHARHKQEAEAAILDEFFTATGGVRGHGVRPVHGMCLGMGIR